MTLFRNGHTRSGGRLDLYFIQDSNVVAIEWFLLAHRGARSRLIALFTRSAQLAIARLKRECLISLKRLAGKSRLQARAYAPYETS